MTINKFGTAHWEGNLKEGKGTVSLESGAMSNNPYGFNTRFEGAAGTNPEELIAASHAACFSMAYSLVLEGAGLKADAIDTKAVITLEKLESGFAVTKSALTCTVKCDGDEAAIREAADGAKQNCPISKLLNCDITLDLTIS